jgi:hypothetical protein
MQTGPLCVQSVDDIHLPAAASFWRLCITEFQGFFYLYQLSMYSVQFWNAYLVYGAFNGIVVIISGLLNVYMIYKNEHTIQSLTKYITNIRVGYRAALCTDCWFYFGAGF